MCPNPQFPADFVWFTEEILNGKLHFLCSVSSISNGIGFWLVTNISIYENSGLKAFRFYLQLLFENGSKLFQFFQCLVQIHKDLFIFVDVVINKNLLYNKFLISKLYFNFYKIIFYRKFFPLFLLWIFFQ